MFLVCKEAVTVFIIENIFEELDDPYLIDATGGCNYGC